MTATTTAARRFWRAAAVAGLMVMASNARAQLSVSGSPAKMTITAATAGSAPTAVSNTSTTYSLTGKPPGILHYAITASINTAMPAGVTLKITLAASLGVSAGPVALGTTAQNVVTGITNAMSSQVITYTLSATPAAGVVASSTRTVTLTRITTP
jgi:hypothetical protein